MADELRAFLATGSDVQIAPQPAVQGWPKSIPWIWGFSAICVMLIAAALLLRSGTGRQSDDRSHGGSALAPQGSAPLVPVTEPLRVLSLDVHHVANGNDASGEARGIIGKDSFTAKLNDRVTIQARLSRPAYAYLIAFRPDGQMEVCYPEDETQPPPL